MRRIVRSPDSQSKFVHRAAPQSITENDKPPSTDHAQLISHQDTGTTCRFLRCDSCTFQVTEPRWRCGYTSTRRSVSGRSAIDVAADPSWQSDRSSKPLTYNPTIATNNEAYHLRLSTVSGVAVPSARCQFDIELSQLQLYFPQQRVLVLLLLDAQSR
jgi:hypothetical protein